MDRVAVFVDAGYLFAEGSRVLSGRKLSRSAVILDHRIATDLLKRFAWQKSGLSLLRIYWYDGSRQRPTTKQIALAEQDDVKLRLGRVDGAGRQRGVDALIVNDLVSLARNRAMTDCVLLSGDEELRIAVAEVQHLGVRVHLLGIGPIRRTQSRLLRREADSIHEWDAATLGVFMRCRPHGSSRAENSLAKVVGTGSGRGLPPLSTAGHIREVTQHLVRQVLIREFAARTGRRPRSLASAAASGVCTRAC